MPSGHVTTYSDIAAAIGRPKAVRAVGTAVGRNPVSWLIPCHRALRKAGGLGGYHWGLGVKRAMLAWEAARLEVGGVRRRFRRFVNVLRSGHDNKNRFEADMRNPSRILILSRRRGRDRRLHQHGRQPQPHRAPAG